jgi:hypothetical protein
MIPARRLSRYRYHHADGSVVRTRRGRGHHSVCWNPACAWVAGTRVTDPRYAWPMRASEAGNGGATACAGSALVSTRVTYLVWRSAAVR